MTYNIITIFPHIFDSYFNESIIRRAQDKNLIKINTIDLRDYTDDKRRTIDDAPYGGGAGMIMKVEPIYKALRALNFQFPISNFQTNSKLKIKKSKTKIILLSAKGKKWTQKKAKQYSKLNNIILICGRYEGVDERVVKLIDEEISIGDYVLTGGEIGAMTIVDSITRLIPGVVGNPESIISESHSIPGQLEYPQYTRPEVFEISNPSTSSTPKDEQAGRSKLRVPKVLLSGNHKKIDNWREKKIKKAKK